MLTPRIRVLTGAVEEAVRRGPRTDVLALPLAAGQDGQPPAPDARSRALAALLGADLAAAVRLEKAKGRAGEVTRVPWAPGADDQVDRVLLVGVGEGSPADLRTAGAALARAVRGHDRLVTTIAAGANAARASALVEGLVLASYRPPRTGVSDAPTPPVRRIDLVGRYSDAGVEHGGLLANATLRARDLTNTPSSTKGPAWVATKAKQAAAQSGLTARVWDDKALRAEGFGGLVAVGSGAARGPRLVQLSYEPAGATRHVVLVGKGITFDTGGISIKPRDAMIPMKTDMSGAAVVLSVLAACSELGVKVRVTGLLPLAENAFGGGSYRPGDVVTMYGGTTVEVRNTDAEGRMVLGDALAYADRHLEPDLLVDIATLTGAQTQTFGRTHGALLATDDRLAAALTAAGEDSGERLWRMPLVEDYREVLDSDVADLCHISTRTGKDAPGAGIVVPALFLREFTGGRRWAHLDVAGPSRSDKDTDVITKGGTGWGTRLLLRWLEGLR